MEWIEPHSLFVTHNTADDRMMGLGEFLRFRRPRKYSDVLLAHRGKIADKWTGLLPVYDLLFSRFQDSRLALLEIGVKNGGSLEVHENFFRNACAIVGVDVDRRCGDLTFSSHRIHVILGDAGCADTYDRVAAHSDRFGIVLDDGSHKSSDIVTTFARYFPILAPGGIYVAEDLCCSYWKAY